MNEAKVSLFEKNPQGFNLGQNNRGCLKFILKQPHFLISQKQSYLRLNT